MGRIEDKFNILKKQNRKALITFVTAGDPDIATTVRIVEEMEKRGADIIELGIPYSDPIAEGPVIQAANARALKHNIKIIDIMLSVKEIRKTVIVPLLYLLYFNCIVQYGIDRFFANCASAGLDGVIIPDLPFEERGELEETAEKYGIIIITLVAPTSGERIELLTSKAKGFVYCVSSLGVTGVRSTFNTNFEAFFSRINSATSIPKAIGFGISSVEHITQLKDYCDGLIVGSAMVKKIETAQNADEAVAAVGQYTAELRAAMDSL